MAPPQVSSGTWSAFNRYLYVSFKQNSGERFSATCPPCFHNSKKGTSCLITILKYKVVLNLIEQATTIGEHPNSHTGLRSAVGNVSD